MYLGLFIMWQSYLMKAKFTAWILTGLLMFFSLNCRLFIPVPKQKFWYLDRSYLLLEASERFQSVDHRNHTYVFSAHHDTLSSGLPGVLRVMALTLVDQKTVPYLKCLLVYKEGIGVVDASIERIPEDHGFTYTAAFIVCPLELDIFPSAVSVVSTEHPYVVNKIPVYSHIPFNPESDFLVCIPPLQGNYDDVSQLVEFLEVNRILGADKLTFYNHSISARVRDILHRYTDRGLVEVVDWHLPFDAYTSADGYVNIHYFGQLAATNDCLYRNRHKTRYIVSIDLDEFIVPRANRTLADLTTFLVGLNPSAGSFIFQCYFFYTFLPDHKSYFLQKTIAKKYNILTLLKTNRTLQAWPKDSRTKYIYNPKRVSVVGIHFVWNTLPKFTSVAVDVGIGSLHHYRNVVVSPASPNSTIDAHMHRYQNVIAKRVKSAWSSLP